MVVYNPSSEELSSVLHCWDADMIKDVCCWRTSRMMMFYLEAGGPCPPSTPCRAQVCIQEDKTCLSHQVLSHHPSLQASAGWFLCSSLIPTLSLYCCLSAGYTSCHNVE